MEEIKVNEIHVDYKEMYFKMMRASEEAINVLIRAQQECEELYLDGIGDA